MWLGTWESRIKLEIDNTKFGSNLANFPVMIHLGSSTGLTRINTTPVLDVVGASARKIAITTSDGVTQCYAEIVRWDSVAREACLYVKVPVLSGSAKTVLYLYYDINQPDNTYVGYVGSVAAQNVWDDNFVGVWHLSENGGSYMDSTINRHDGSSPGGGGGGGTTIVSALSAPAYNNSTGFGNRGWKGWNFYLPMDLPIKYLSIWLYNEGATPGATVDIDIRAADGTGAPIGSPLLTFSRPVSDFGAAYTSIRFTAIEGQRILPMGRYFVTLKAPLTGIDTISTQIQVPGVPPGNFYTSSDSGLSYFATGYDATFELLYDSVSYGGATTPVRVEAPFGFMQRFDGNDDEISIPSSIDFSALTTKKFTVSGWLSLTTLQPAGSNSYCRFLGKSDSGQHEWFLQIFNKDAPNDGRPQWVSMYVHNPSGGQGAGDYTMNPAGIAIGELYYFTGTIEMSSASSGVILLYKNAGIRNATDDWGNRFEAYGVTYTNGNAPLRIGATYGNFFPGLLGEIKISRVVRPLSWVKASYYSELDSLLAIVPDDAPPPPPPPPVTPPTVETVPVTDVTENLARLNGNLISLGSDLTVDVSFQIGTSTGYGTTIPVGVMTSPGNFSAVVSLNPDTTYHFRAVAVGDGTVYGSDNVFTTLSIPPPPPPPPEPPTVSTLPATGISENTATLNGNLAIMGSALGVDVYFQVGTTTDYGTTIPVKSMAVAGGFAIGIGGLAPNTTYHFRAVADGDGISYGADEVFTTLDVPPPPPPPTGPSSGVLLLLILGSGAVLAAMTRVKKKK